MLLCDTLHYVAQLASNKTSEIHEIKDLNICIQESIIRHGKIYVQLALDLSQGSVPENAV